jgi:AmmeMemoRadiSam system protein B/AmmeMemoRadiSam system protein A
MNPRTVLVTTLLSVFSFLYSLPPVPAHAHEIRNSIVAGTFYPAAPSELEQLIEHYVAAAAKTDVRPPEGMHIKAVIMPHAGYVYSGLTAAHAASVLKGAHFTKVIVMGPDHRIGFKNASISGTDAYETPLGQVKIHEDANRLKRSYDIFQVIELSDRYEHSIEVVLPFLQSSLADFSLIPIVMGPGKIHSYAAALSSVLDEDTLLVVSSDFSHYLPYEQAATRDRETIDMIVSLNEEGLGKGENRACGIIPILVTVHLARQRGWKPMLLHYSNSGDTAGMRDQVVGYAAIAFYGGPMQKTFSEEQGQALVRLARKTIQERLGIQAEESESLSQTLAEDAFQAKRGVFVTLNKNGRLRGCIGCLEARECVLDGVRHNAINAAFRDPRFNPVVRSEMDAMDIEISILTDPMPLEYTDYKDLLAKLRPGIDGVIIRSGYASATFLPQVWDQLPEKEEFLAHLCAKAGLPVNAWRQEKLEVSTYQVQYFEEPK